MVSGSNVKHIFVEHTGETKVQRVLPFSLPHPFNYGFIPGTKSDDGDELDIFVLSSRKIDVGELVNARPIGVLLMEDENGTDNKIISVKSSDQNYTGVDDIEDIDKQLMNTITYYVQHNKDGIEGKFVKIHGTGNSSKALDILENVEKSPN